MPKPTVKPGQIWQDDCYYLDTNSGECMRKYVLILAVDQYSDALAAVFTSKSNGLTEDPACSLGPPRAGYYVGVLGKPLQKQTWVDFSSLETLDIDDLKRHIASGRTTLTQQTLPTSVLCAVLRCLLQSDDVSKRQASLLGDTSAALNCA